MKEYIVPQMSVTYFDAQDIIQVSGSSPEAQNNKNLFINDATTTNAGSVDFSTLKGN